MTLDPAAASLPVDSHGGAMSAHLGLILHVTTNHGDPYNFFADPSHQASSTWWVSDDGTLEQYADADLRAWAQADGNSTYNSVETSGTPDEPLTSAQIETLAQLYAWGHQTYGWPLQLAETPGDPGLGWHGMGGDAWGGHTGCPGDLRMNQRPAILDRAAQMSTADPKDLAMSPDDLRQIVREEVAVAIDAAHADIMTAMTAAHADMVVAVHGSRQPGDTRNSLDSIAALLKSKH